MIGECLLQFSPQLPWLLSLKRGRDDALTMHFHRDRANKRFPFAVIRPVYRPQTGMET
jgi:hypothetical protein